MIIQRRADQYLFIAQGAHAALSATIMAAWTLDGLPRHPRRTAILTATRHHDDGWAEEDRELHVGTAGEPLDFIAVPPAVKRRIWPRAAERLARSPYVAALVAAHALAIHDRMAGDPGWHEFFQDLERRRDTLLGRAARDHEVLRADYRFVRTGDLLSLIFCNGWREPMAGDGYRAILDAATLRIEPDPFAGRAVTLHVEARTLPVRPYATAADLRDAYAAAPVTALEGVAVGA